jgi:hypothetical protein
MNIKNRLRLKAVEAKLKPPAIEQHIIKITRAGCSDNPISWSNHHTAEVYAVNDDLSHLQGFNVLMAVYSNGD